MTALKKTQLLLAVVNWDAAKQEAGLSLFTLCGFCLPLVSHVGHSRRSEWAFA